MASDSLAPDRTVEPLSQAESQNGIDPGAGRDNQPLLDAPLALQVPGSSGSQKSSDRASSSEHTNATSDLKEDRTLPLPGSQEIGPPPLTTQTSAWQSKYILSLGKRGNYC
jgi:hypothetical protein